MSVYLIVRRSDNEEIIFASYFSSSIYMEDELTSIPAGKGLGP